METLVMFQREDSCINMKKILFTTVFAALVLILPTTVIFAVGFSYNCDIEVECSECPPVGSCLRTIQCGCCKICVQLLKKNAVCSSSFNMVLQSPAECAPGLVCNPYSKTCTSDHSYLKQLKNIACQGRVCQCSFNGKILKEYEYLRSSQVTPNSCKCAAKKAKYRVLKLNDKTFNCTRNGSFEKVQCVGSICFCVNEDGKKLKEQGTFKMSNFKKSPC
ncbi:uncharacterized protein LOC106877885 isoform X3 [Octopus bimaculoides]|uniref:uncharacterized protein LOC106877885 isoform X3 n=1 Tax=Octopus bimaculoides TaxID=37653 RepID=UPI0022DEA022|nr:uncharacterized protein LOC106877885 isoform X3 [Octopus bimaculoides]